MKWIFDYYAVDSAPGSLPMPSLCCSSGIGFNVGFCVDGRKNILTVGTSWTGAFFETSATIARLQKDFKFLTYFLVM
jgi:hypothetical protein